MTRVLKRKLSSTSQPVSPPRIRQRVSSSNQAGTGDDSAGANLRFYSWNINGIGPLLQKKINFSRSGVKSPYPLRVFLHEHHWPHALCLQEVKISPSDAKTQRLVEVAANFGSQPSEPTYTAHFSLPRDKYNATGFGGKVHGVATLIRDDITYPAGLVNNAAESDDSAGVLTTRPDWDLEGRVLIHEFTAIRLIILNGYWVNGTSNPYRDPITGDVSGTRHEHKLRFHEHMFQLCNEYINQGKQVLLIGDMNIAPARIDGHPNLRTSPIQHVKNRADFNAKFLKPDSQSDFCGVDVFRSLHGDKKKFTYHGRGRPWGESCDRVDLVIASRKLVDDEAVTGVDICDSPQERGHSDHVPLWVEIDPAKLRQEGSGALFDSSAEADHG